MTHGNDNYSFRKISFCSSRKHIDQYNSYTINSLYLSIKLRKIWVLTRGI